MKKIITLAGLCLATLVYAQTDASLYTFRTADGNVNNHLFVGLPGDRITLAAYSFNHPNPTIGLDYTLGTTLRFGQYLSVTPAFSAEYERQWTAVGAAFYISGKHGKLSLNIPLYTRILPGSNELEMFIPGGRLGYAVREDLSLGLETKQVHSPSGSTALLGGFIKKSWGNSWVSVSYLGKVTGGQNELRFVVGTRF